MSLKAPKTLSKTAKKEFKRLAQALYWLEDTDAALLAMRCAAFAEMQAAEVDVKERGPLIEGTRGRIIANPSTRMARVSRDQVAKLDLRLERLRNRKRQQEPAKPPPGFSGPEPRHGWELERLLCLTQEEADREFPEAARKRREMVEQGRRNREAYYRAHPQEWKFLEPAERERFENECRGESQ